MNLVDELMNNVVSVAELSEYQQRSLRALFQLTVSNIPSGDNLPIKKTECDIEEVVRLFNMKFGEKLPKVTKINGSRKKIINARYKEFGYEGIKQVFEKVENSEFLMNGNGTWTCTLDFIFSPSGFVKILEGNYDRKGNNSNTKQGLNNPSIFDFADRVLQEDQSQHSFH